MYTIVYSHLNMQYKIITDKQKLRIKSDNVQSMNEGDEIATKLEEILTSQSTYHSISAPQIGIYKRVFVVRNPTTGLIERFYNPVVVGKSKERMSYVEGDISFPKKVTSTIRNLAIILTALNKANEIEYGPDKKPISQDSLKTDIGALYSVLIQHELDHLDGILMGDIENRFSTTIRREIPKFGRNEIVMLKKGNELKQVKYKKADQLITDGWTLI